MANKTIIKILGTAQDAGYPQLGCSCAHCQAARKDKNLKRKASSIAVLDKEVAKTFILDATPAFSKQYDSLNQTAVKYNFSKDHLSGILLTHAHIGHYTGLIYLGKEALNIKNLPIYLSQKMFNFLKENSPWADLFNNRNLNKKIFQFEKEYSLSPNISFQAVEVEHRNEHADTAAFIVKSGSRKFLYLPDFDSWKSFEKRFRKIIKKVDYAFIDGTFFDKKELKELRGRDLTEVPHPTILESMDLLSDLKLENKAKIYFTHFNHTNRILAQKGKKIAEIEKRGFMILNEETEF